MSDTSATAFEVAGKFLSARRGDPVWTSLRLSTERTPQQTAIFWHGEIPLTEISLQSGDGSSRGYMLVSGDPRLPPILEYSESGRPLTETLAERMKGAYPDARLERVVFMSSTQLAAEATYEGRRFLIEFPSLWSKELTAPYRSGVDPMRVFDKGEMESLRQSSASPPQPSEREILNNAVPVKYNQNCSKYASRRDALQLGAEVNPCAPNAVVGCVPVAWAMWLSSAKRLKCQGSERIWSNSACWSEDWGDFSPGDNPSRCPDVASTIWKLHSLMSTSPSGETAAKDNMAGAEVFRDFGLSWKFEGTDKADLAAVSNLIPYGFPLIWCSQGDWQGPGTGAVGHGVVIYGYDRSAGTVRICMGWGASQQDRDVNWSQFSSTALIHRASSIFG